MIQADKIKHFLVGGGIALIVGLIVGSNGYVFDEPVKGCFVGFFVGTYAGMLKEFIWDHLLGKGTPEFMDVIYTVVGSAVFSFILYLFIR